MMIDFDVTVNNVDKVARTFRGGAGPSGTDAEQLKHMSLVYYGNHSFKNPKELQL